MVNNSTNEASIRATNSVPTTLSRTHPQRTTSSAINRTPTTSPPKANTI